MNKTSKIAITFALAIAGAAAASVLARDDGRDDEYARQLVKRGYELVPPGVRLNLQGKNRAMVGLGSYIVNTSGCIDCHSHPT